MYSDKVVKYHSHPDTLAEYWAKLWRYRLLILTFARRDIKVKYSQTFLGPLWVLLSPFPVVVIFNLFFGRVVKLNTGSQPNPVFALTGLIGWGYFSNLNVGIGGSMIDAQNIIRKLYFPKLVLALAKVISSGVDFMVSFAVIFVVMLAMGVTPKWTIIFFPLFLLLNIICGFAIGIWIAALTFRYRDLQHFVYQFLNFSIWLTPVFYPTTILPQNLTYIMYANPMAFVISGYRYTLSGSEVPALDYVMSLIPLFIVLVSGLMYFRRVEDKMAENI